MSGQLYAHNAVEVQQSQMQNCNTQDLYAKPGCSSDNSISHSINADIGKFAYTTIMRAIT